MRILKLFLCGLTSAGLMFGATHGLTLEQLTSRSEKIVAGTVISKVSYWTPDSLIHSDVVVSPGVFIKGAEQGPIVVTVAGGQIGGLKMSVSDAPEFRQGEDVLVFLAPSGGHLSVVGRSAGKFTVRGNSGEGSQIAVAALQLVVGSNTSSGRAKHSELTAWLQRRSGIAAIAAAPSAITGVCYSSAGERWAANSVSYSIGPGIPPAWQPSIAAASATWNSAGANFSFRSDANSPNILSFVDLVAKYGSGYNETYALTTTWTNFSSGEITKAAIEFNTDFQWSTTGEAGKADVQNIATHEFGHWLQLDDIYQPASCSEVTMWGYAAAGETKKRTLEQPDINGILALYGPALAPASPYLLTPGNGASGVPVSSLLVWTPAAGATSYDVYLGVTAAPSLVASVAGTSFQAWLSPGTIYYWRVVARNAAGSSSSATNSFITAGGTLFSPVLIAPANGANSVPTTTMLNWSLVPGATVYDVYVGLTPSPLLLGSTASQSVQISGLQSGTLYYWKIVARNSITSSLSPVGYFRTN